MKGRDKVIYKGITDCLKQTARNEGRIRAFFLLSNGKNRIMNMSASCRNPRTL